tara:strand:- start:826 stop:1995 length:1170 start_codon:yes stop_codon:yes gene_type:complete
MLKLIEKKDFYDSLTSKNEVLNTYNKLTLIPSKNNVFYNANTTEQINSKHVLSAKLFPCYLQPEFNTTEYEGLKKLPLNKINGFAIQIDKSSDIETFMKVNYSKNFRGNIKRAVSRFEICFKVAYEMNYGSITESKYNSLMASLHGMLRERFTQRNDKNKVLNNWDYYLQSSFKLINEKKASLFVIYQNQIPVSICLNHHFNKILFISIPSYDINFSKFSLGNISIFKMLEWGHENNYILLDMAYGELDYKRRWSNYLYTFEHHIFYSQNKPIHSTVVFIEASIIKLKNYLKNINLDDLITKIKNKLKKTFSPAPLELEYDIVFSENISIQNLKRIQQDSLDFSIIQKPVYDFLYREKIPMEIIEIFEIKKGKEYLVNYENVNHRILIK